MSGVNHVLSIKSPWSEEYAHVHRAHGLSCLLQVSMLARRIQSEGRICLALGGDHSVSIGTLDATVNAHDDVAVIWVT